MNVLVSHKLADENSMKELVVFLNFTYNVKKK